VTALTTDALRESGREVLGGPVTVASDIVVGVRIMAKKAFSTHRLEHSRVIGVVVASRNGPPVRLHVPGKWQLEKFSQGGLVEIIPYLSPGPQDPIHLNFKAQDIFS